MKKRCWFVVLLLIFYIFLLMPSFLLAQAKRPEVEVDVQIYKEVEVRRDGRVEPYYEPVAEVKAGDKLLYKILYTNKSNTVAYNVVIVYEIPKGTKYEPNSAGGEGAEVGLSNDGGKSYKKAVYQKPVNNADTLLDESNKEHEAITNIMWVVKKQIPPGKTGELFFKVIVDTPYRN